MILEVINGVEIMSLQELKKYEVRAITIDYKEKKIYNFFKRCLDILASIISLVVLSPLFLIISVMIKLTSKGPVIYTSIRYGKNGKPFKFYKFRSMYVDADDRLDELIAKDDGNSSGIRFKAKDDPRVTKFGKFIRKTSLDELPQLINILNGSMTIVGPRPAIGREIDFYTDEQKQRMLVKQGLTCIWQCSGRSNVSFENQIEMDLTYIKKRGFFYDIYIILKTIPAVLFHKGAQ